MGIYFRLSDFIASYLRLSYFEIKLSRNIVPSIDHLNVVDGDTTVQRVLTPG